MWPDYYVTMWEY